jgi:hypothetical protein
VEGAGIKAFSGEPLVGGPDSETGIPAAGPENGAAKPSRAELLRVAESLVPEPIKRRGRPPGLPKTGGRKAGTPNKVTRDIRALCQRYTVEMVQEARKLAKNATHEQTRLAAQALILAYGNGKPVEAHEISGRDGGPIRSEQRLEEQPAVQRNKTAAMIKMIAEAARAQGDAP